MIFVSKNSKPKDTIQFHNLRKNLEEYFQPKKFKKDLKIHTPQKMAHDYLSCTDN